MIDFLRTLVKLLCLTSILTITVSAKLISSEFDNQTALVVGGSSGIGRAAVRLLGERCASVIHITSRAAGELAEAVEEVAAVNRSHCAGPMFVAGHVSDASSLVDARALREELRGAPLDLAINCAGIGGFLAPLSAIPDEAWFGPHDAVRNNVYAVMFMVQLETELMREFGRGGSIVNLASEQGVVGCPGCTMYGASKHAIVGITRSVALEVAPEGIRVNALAPGLVSTPLTWNQARGLGDSPIQPFQCVGSDGALVSARFTCDEGCDCPNIPPDDPRVKEIITGYAAVNPLGRVAEASEVAEAALYLLSKRSSFVTGTVMRIDGGDTAS